MLPPGAGVMLNAQAQAMGLPTMINPGAVYNPRKRGIFTDPDESPMARQARIMNPEYITAFQVFDRDGSGTIDVGELGNALQAVKTAVEAGTPRQVFQTPFKLSTLCSIAGRFAGGPHLSGEQFCSAMDYMSTLKRIFAQVDVDRSGSIEVQELVQALQLSGVNLHPNAVLKILQSYDEDISGSIKFDEFTQLRLEFDIYILAWDRCCTMQGMTAMAPQQMLGLLQEMQRHLEPYGSVFRNAGVTAAFGLQGLIYSTMMMQQRGFNVMTCEALILRFGAPPNPCICFEHFIDMMTFLKNVTAKFRQVDVNQDGCLELPELVPAFASLGMNFDPNFVSQIARRYDQDGSNMIRFDEFVRLLLDWEEWAGLAAPCGGVGGMGGWGARELQQLFGTVRTRYYFSGGAVEALRPYSLTTCRRLVARFGCNRPGECFPTRLNHMELMNLHQTVMMWRMKFTQIDMSDMFQNGVINPTQLGLALRTMGLNLNLHPTALASLAWQFDQDKNGTIEFDEFLQVMLDLELYVAAITRQRATLGMAGGMAGGFGMDESAFISLIFSVPRY